MSEYEYTMGKELDLEKEQERTLSTPALPANLFLKVMFVSLDVLYGRRRTLQKFKVLEILARYPYMAWESGSYARMTRRYARPTHTGKAASEYSLRHIDLGRRLQDNEQWHLMILDDIIKQRGIRLGLIHYFFLPRVMALTYYFMTRFIYWLNPVWSFAMNAAFESHAEHEYMKMAQENPGWEKEIVETACFDSYPRQKNLRDLIRRIGLDERDHIQESLEEVQRHLPKK